MLNYLFNVVYFSYYSIVEFICFILFSSSVADEWMVFNSLSYSFRILIKLKHKIINTNFNLISCTVFECSQTRRRNYILRSNTLVYINSSLRSLSLRFHMKLVNKLWVVDGNQRQKVEKLAKRLTFVVVNKEHRSGKFHYLSLEYKSTIRAGKLVQRWPSNTGYHIQVVNRYPHQSHLSCEHITDK